MSDTRAPVSVIVPTFNRAAYLPDALDSVLGQTTRPAEVIVVNDGSTDETASVARRYGARIRYLEKDNGGKCSSINAALEIAQEPYVWVFDDDDVACADAIERHLAVLERDAGVGFTISGSYRCREEPDTRRLVVVRSQAVRPFDDDDHFVELLLSSYIAGPSTIIRRGLIDRVGPYRTDLARVDDFEMAVRLSLVSRPARLDDPRPTYYRRWHDGLRGWKSRQFSYAESVARSRAEERMVLRDLAPRIEPRHYLPRRDWERPMDEQAQLRSSLRRWIVAVQKHLWPEADEAGQAFVARGPARLAGEVLAWAQRAFSDPAALAELAGDRQSTAALGRLLRVPEALPLRRALLRQVYYHTRRGGSERDLRRVSLAWQVGARVLGVRGTASALAAR